MDIKVEVYKMEIDSDGSEQVTFRDILENKNNDIKHLYFSLGFVTKAPFELKQKLTITIT